MKTFWSWLKNLPPILIVSMGILIVANSIYFLLFVMKFASTNLSDDPLDWANTATYINLIISVINLVVFVILSVLVYQYNIQRGNSTAAFQYTIVKPVLVFNSVNGDLNADGSRDISWQIKNIGNGSAINLWVAYKQDRREDWITPVAKCYSLAKDDTLDVAWVNGPDVMVVLYQDTFKNDYCTLVMDDEIMWKI